MVEKSIRLKKGRERSLLLRHPWIFASAVENVAGEPEIGETVNVMDNGGKKLARAAFSPNSQIRARVWTFTPDEPVNEEFLYNRILAARERRLQLPSYKTASALRLFYGEADGLPGLVVDKYNDTLIMQILSAGAEIFKSEITEKLKEIYKPDCIFERSDVEIRALEGLQERKGLVFGRLPKEEMSIEENGIRYKVDIVDGQKTGFYLDQRENRQKVNGLAEGLDVLNCFCYTGGFTLNTLAGGAKSVVSVDSSESALSLLKENLELNGLYDARSELIEADVFKYLRLLRDQGKNFDLIVLDPPKFAPTIAQAEKASRAYKDINLLAIKMLRPGGLLVTFSCSGGITRELFQKIIAGAANDAGVDLRILEHLSQSSDHPVLLNFPESFYLKGLICKK
mgnify:CR=1 FL=1